MGTALFFRIFAPAASTKFKLMELVNKEEEGTICRGKIMAIKDTMEVLSGKWKFHIIGTLLLHERLRFMDLLREIEGIGAKMLSKELQDMEMNRLITRTVMDTKPITVEYQITQYGRTLSPIIEEMASWGTAYRQSLHEK